MTSSTPARDPRWHHDSPEEIPGLFGLERARLVDLLGSLTSGDWARPTPCPGWSILDLCGHLLGDDLGWLARHRNQHQPTVNAPTTDDASLARWLDDLQDKWVQAARRLSPPLVTDLLAWSGPQVVAGLANQDPTAVKGSVSWAGPGPVPVWLDQLREVSEQWIHRQQLLQARGCSLPKRVPTQLGRIRTAVFKVLKARKLIFANPTKDIPSLGAWLDHRNRTRSASSSPQGRS